MRFFEQLKIFALTCLKTLFAFSAWVAIMALALNTIIYFKTIRYDANDIIDPRFQVVTLTNDNQPKIINLESLKNQKILESITDTQWYGENFLRKDGDILIYHNEGAMWYIESSYKVVNGKVQPISFLLFTFFEPLHTLFLSIIFYGIAKYIFLRCWYRNSMQKIQELNQHSVIIAKGFLIFIILIVVLYGIINKLS